MKIKHYHENPPTAGLPIRWHDWLARNKDLSKCIEALFNLPPLSITCSGTIALVVALKTLAKDNPNRKCVIIPAYTCPLVALAINHCGLKIILCDVAKNSFDFDFEKLALLLNDQVLAVIPTHLGGRIANVAAVKKLTISYNITIIEDAAQALGAEVGKEGDIIIFSLATGKGLTMYEGGLLTANTPELRQKIAETIRQIPRNIYWETKRTIELAGYTALYNPLGLYFAYGIAKRKALKKENLIDAVGDYFDFNLPYHKVSKLRQNIASSSACRLPDFIKATTIQAKRRIVHLKKITNITVITDGANDKGTWPFIMILLPSKTIRDTVLQQLWPSNLGVSRLFIHALPNYTYLSQIVPQISMPNAEDFAERMLTITNSLWLQDAEFNSICQTLQANMIKC